MEVIGAIAAATPPPLPAAAFATAAAAAAVGVASTSASPLTRNNTTSKPVEVIGAIAAATPPPLQAAAFATAAAAVVVVAGLDVCKHATLSHELVREQHAPVRVWASGHVRLRGHEGILK